MAKKQRSNNPDSSSELRSRAEERDMARILHELEVHQVELEMEQVELVRTRMMLDQSLSMYTELYDFAPSEYLTLGRDGRILQANLAATKLLGVDRSRLLGMHFIAFVVPAAYQVLDDLLETVFSKKVSGSCELQLITGADEPYREHQNLSGHTVRIDASVCETSHGCRIILSDITEYKKTESELQRLNRALMATNSCNQILIHSTDEIDLLRHICNIMVEIGGYRMAWIGYAEHDKDKTIYPVAQAGYDDGFINSIRITWADVALGQGPTGTAIRTAESCIMRDIRKEPKFKLLLDKALKRGYASVQSIPLNTAGKVFGAITIYSDIPDSFSAKETELLTALVNNVAYGITMLRNKKSKEHAELELIASNARLSQALEAAHAGVWEWNLSTNENIWSDELWALYGLQRRSEKPTFQLWENTIHPEDRDSTIQSVTSATGNETEVNIEYRVCYPDESVHWIMSRGRPLRNDKDEVVRYIGTVIDITERKLAESELKKLSAAVEQSPASVVIADALGHVEYVNDRFTQLTGYTAEEIIGKTPSILESDLTPQAVYDHLWETVLAGQVWKGELYNKKKNGEPYWEFVVISSILDNNGQVINLLSVAEDITDQKQTENALVESEERFRLLFEGHSAIMMLLDPTTGNIIDANRAATDFYGWSHEELCEMRIQEINTLSSKEIDVILDKWNTSDKLNFLFTHRKADGSVSDVEAFGCKIAIRGKAVIYLIIHDITERKQAAEESDRLKAAFLANISHEIRTPMNGILGFSELLKDPQLTGEEQAEYIDLIHQSGQRMLNLINDIMDISKIDAREVKLLVSETSINQLLNNLLAFSKLEANIRGLRLSCTTGLPDSESIIETDSTKLTQILTNLIQNALKFTSKGGIDIGYTRKGNLLEFYVIDSGIGIPADKKEKIFERFHQADNSLTRNYEGSGLGLSISKAFVELLGGTIRVESVEGAGSTFAFTLPYTPVITAEASSAAIPDSAEEAPGICILIAEDDDVSTLLLKRNLKGENITTLCAENGWEAVELVQHHREINLVLMDIKMPIMNGFEATKLIKQQRPELPVIAQSAFTSKEEREKAKDAGCDNFITKPIKKSELLEMMQALLNR